MPRDPRTYITVHDGMPDHPKVEGLSDAAFRLLIESWCYCSRHKTDGHLSAAAWARRGTAKARRELEAAGLVEVEEGGIYFHDYTEHQRTAAEIEEQRQKRADAGRKGGLAKAAAKQSPSNGLASASPELQQMPGPLLSKPLAVTDTDTDKEIRPPAALVTHLRDTAPPADLDDSEPTPTEQLIGEWLTYLGPDQRPPSAIVTQVGRQITQLLAEGMPYAHVKTGLVRWQEKGDLGPGAIPAIVHEVRTARPRRPPRQADTDDQFGRMLARAAAAEQKAINS